LISSVHAEDLEAFLILFQQRASLERQENPGHREGTKGDGEGAYGAEIMSKANASGKAKSATFSRRRIG
jgi:hypothetical protein